jgi:hypothetical protein
MKNRISSFVVIVSIMCIPSISFPQTKVLGIFESQNDIGKVNKPGSATYDAEKQEYTIEGSGANMWFDHDEFHFVWKRVISPATGRAGYGIRPGVPMMYVEMLPPREIRRRCWVPSRSRPRWKSPA